MTANAGDGSGDGAGGRIRRRAPTARVHEMRTRHRTVGPQVDGWLVALAEDGGRQDIQALLGERARTLRERGAFEEVVDLWASWAMSCTDVGQQVFLWREAARTLEDDLDAPDRAFSALLASYRLRPERSLWPELERLAALADGWDDLLEELAAGVPELPRGEWADALVHIALRCDAVLEDRAGALEYLALALEIDADHREADELRLQLLREGTDHAALAAALDARAAQEPSPSRRGEILVELAEVYAYKTGDLELALATCRRAVACDPWRDEARRPYEALLRQSGRYAELAQSLEERLGGLVGAEEAAIRRELLALYTGELDDTARAIEHGETLLASAVADAGLLRALARLYAAQGRVYDQIEVLETLLGLVDDATRRAALCRELARLWREQGELPRAAECLEWAISYGGPSESTLRDLVALYRVDGAWTACIDLLTRHAEAVDPQARAALLCEAASIYEHELDDAGCAIDYYERARAAAPERVDALAGLARLHERNGDIDEAVTALAELAERVDPEATGERAALCLRAGELALGHGDDRSAEMLLLRALEADPSSIEARRALAVLHRQAGRLDRAARLLEEALATASTGTSTARGRARERAGLLAEAGALREALGDDKAAAGCYREALALDPGNDRAAARLALLLWNAEDYDALAPLLERLVADDPDHPDTLERLLRLGRSERARGKRKRARSAFERAAKLDPFNLEAQLEAGRLALALGDHDAAHAALSALIDRHGRALGADEWMAITCDLARCCIALGRPDDARSHVNTALGADPRHPGALALLAELERDRPFEFIEASERLLEVAPDDQHGHLLHQMGDVFMRRLDDPERALDVYMRARLLLPDDHILLHKCLDILVAQEDWEECKEILGQLIDTEPDPDVRAKYRFTLAMIYRDELRDPEQAKPLLAAALADDPDSTAALEAFEDIARERGDWKGLAEVYIAALKHVGTEKGDGRDEERLRLWTELADVCSEQLGDFENALYAYEVAVELAGPAARPLRERLAELYAKTGQHDRAIAHAQRLVTAHKHELAYYWQLERAYREAGQPERAALVAEARRCVRPRAESGEGQADEPPAPLVLTDTAPLSEEQWIAVRHPDEDRTVSALFSLVGPVFAAAYARPHRELGLRDEWLVASGDPRRFAALLRHIARAFDMSVPVAYANPDQAAALRVAMIAGPTGGVPAIVFGRPVLGQGAPADADNPGGAPSDAATDELHDRELAFMLAREMCLLRASRRIRHVFAKPDDLAHVIDAVLSLAHDEPEPDDERPDGGRVVTHTARAIRDRLKPLALDRVVALGREVAATGMSSLEATRAWLAHTDLTASRAGLVIAGDLAACLRVIGRRRPPGALPFEQRALDLVWASVTDGVLAAREQLGRMPPAGAEDARKRGA